jgi:cytoskeletal protein CcmA (bactofilin family)
MFRRTNKDIIKSTINSLIGVSTRIEGDVHFDEGLRIDGHVKGNVIADSNVCALLVISETARVEGEVRAAHLVVNGEIVGQVFSSERLELQPKARITGDVTYKVLEMRGGARLAGKLIHEQDRAPALKLAPVNSALTGT